MIRSIQIRFNGARIQLEIESLGEPELDEIMEDLLNEQHEFDGFF